MIMIETHRVDLVKLRPVPKVKIRTANDVVMLLQEIVDYDRERLIMLYLDGNNRVAGIENISTGTADYAVAHPRELAKGALLMNSVGILWVHNHPSGSCKPSQADEGIHKHITELFKLLRIRAIDGLIIGRECYYSFSDNRSYSYERKTIEQKRTYEGSQISSLKST